MSTPAPWTLRNRTIGRNCRNWETNRGSHRSSSRSTAGGTSIWTAFFARIFHIDNIDLSIFWNQIPDFLDWDSLVIGQDDCQGKPMGDDRNCFSGGGLDNFINGCPGAGSD